MFITEKTVKFVKHNYQNGISQKSGKPYEFGNITYSDGLESIKLNIKPTPQFVGKLDTFVRGDDVYLVLEPQEGFNDSIEFVVTDVRKK